MAAVLMMIFNFLATRFAVVAAFMANAWLVVASSTAAMWAVRATVVVAIYLWMPLPGWLLALPGQLDSLPAGLVWLLDVCEFRTGVGIVLGAWGLRLVVRLGFRLLG